MKAILKYGQFTHMIELPRVMPIVSIMKPQDEPSFYPLSEEDITKLRTTRLEFRIAKEIEQDIFLYEFVGEF